MKRVQELLHTQTSVNDKETSSNNELLERQHIEGTPFTIIGVEEIGYFTAMGKYRLTSPTKTFKEQMQQIESKSWDLFFNTIIAATEQIIENQKQLKS